MTRTEARDLVVALVASYPRDKIANESKLIYIADLLDLDYIVAKTACEAVRRKYDHFPPLAGIWREVETAIMARHPDPVAAWEIARNYATRLHHWRSENQQAEARLDAADYELWLSRDRPDLVERPDAPPVEVMEAVAYVGGVSAILESDNMAVTRAQFRDAYKTVLERRRAMVTQALARTPTDRQELPSGRQGLPADEFVETAPPRGSDSIGI